MHPTVERTTYAVTGRPVAVQVSSDTGENGTYYLYGDHLGSISAVTYEEGDLLGAPIRYEPFGTVRSGSVGGVTDRGLAGHRHNEALGLIYMNARYYLGELGRFASADTIVPDPSNPQSLNRYSYVGNRPLRFNDSTGHCGGDPSNNNPFAENGDIHLDCTPANFDAMMIATRIEWLKKFSLISGADDWFNNIIGILQGFQAVGAGATGSWISMVDGYILSSVQHGYVMATTETGTVGNSNPGTSIWMQFFLQLGSPVANSSDLRQLWGQAEQAATDYGVAMLAASGGPTPTAEERFFLAIGDAYRSAVSNPGTYGQLVADGLGRAGHCGPLTCAAISLSVDLNLGYAESKAFAYWFTNPGSMIGDYSPMYYSTIGIYLARTPYMPYLPPIAVP